MRAGVRRGKARARRNAVLVAALSLLIAVLLPALFSPLATPASAITAPEAEFVRLLNAYRQSNGLAPLLVSELASDAARKHSSDMARYRYFSHVTSQSDWFASGSSFVSRLSAAGYRDWGAVGENIAAGQMYATDVFNAWKASPGHRANMLGSSYRVIGVAEVFRADAPYRFYWTTEFGDKVDATAYDPTKAGPFKDVPAAFPYAGAVVDLSSEGVVDGYADGTYHPADDVLRQQFAKMIIGSLRIPVSERNVCSFRDVAVSGPTGLYADNYIAAAYERGITNGTSAGAFSPQRSISRAQVVTMVVRALEKSRPGALATPPAGYAGAWQGLPSPHGETARKAQYNGLFAGLPVGSLNPYWAMPRGEVAQILHTMESKLGW